MPETIEQCQKTIELEPAAGIPYAILATAYAQIGKRAETLRAAEDAIRVGNSPSGIATAASALARVGQSGKAKQLLNKALEEAKVKPLSRRMAIDRPWSICREHYLRHKRAMRFESMRANTRFCATCATMLPCGPGLCK